MYKRIRPDMEYYAGEGKSRTKSNQKRLYCYTDVGYRGVVALSEGSYVFRNKLSL